MQGSGSEGDAVLYSTWLLGLDWREEGKKGWERKGGTDIQTYRWMEDLPYCVVQDCIPFGAAAQKGLYIHSALLNILTAFTTG